MVCPADQSWTSELNTLSVPSVTMKGGSRMAVTKNPFSAPQRVPMPMPEASAKAGGIPVSTASRPMAIELSTSMAPTDRSIPAVRMINVCARATTPMMVTCCNTIERLNG